MTSETPGLFARAGNYLARALRDGDLESTTRFSDDPETKKDNSLIRIPSGGPYRTPGTRLERELVLFPSYPSQSDFSQARFFPNDNDHSKAYPNYWTGMKAVIEAGHTPLRFSDSLRLRLYLHQQGQKMIRHSHGTNSGIVYKKNSDIVKVVHDLADLCGLVSEPELTDGALAIPNSTYESYPGKEFSKKNLACAQRQDLSSIIRDEFWLELCGGDKDLLGEYAVFVSSLGDNGCLMKVWLGNNHKNKNLVRALCVDKLSNNSDVIGFDYFSLPIRFPAVPYALI